VLRFVLSLLVPSASWKLQSSNPGWGQTYHHSATVALPDSSILVLGGCCTKSEVWKSSDAGATWMLSNADVDWSTRHSHLAVSTRSGVVFVFGGMDGNTNADLNDVWRSSDGGISWAQHFSTAPWAVRSMHAATVLSGGEIMVLGGLGQVSFFNDIWRSSDEGMSWTTSSASWSGRIRFAVAALADGSVLVLGGMADSGFLNDVWHSSDVGDSWTLQTLAAGWSPRQSHSALALPDGGVLVLGGLSPDCIGSLCSDVWHSVGQFESWSEVLPAAPWPPRAGFMSLALGDGSIMVMGSPSAEQGDVWCSGVCAATTTTTVAANSSITDVNPTMNSTILGETTVATTEAIISTSSIMTTVAIQSMSTVSTTSMTTSIPSTTMTITTPRGTSTVTSSSTSTTSTPSSTTTSTFQVVPVISAVDATSSSGRTNFLSTTRQTLPTFAGQDMLQVRTVFTTSNPSDVQSTATSERVLTTTGQTRHEVHVTGTYSPHIPSPTWLIACGIAIVMASLFGSYLLCWRTRGSQKVASFDFDNVCVTQEERPQQPAASVAVQTET